MYDEARRMFSIVYKHDKNPKVIWLIQSILFFEKHDYVSSAKVLSNVESANIFEQSAIDLMRWIALYHQWNTDASLSHIRSSMSYDPVSPIWNLYLAKIYLGQNNILRAQSFLDIAKKEWLDTKDIDFVKAWILYAQQEYEASLQLLEWQIVGKIDSVDHIDLLTLKARNYEALWNEKEAINIYLEMFESDNSRVSLLEKIFHIYKKDMKYSSASLIISKALEMDETNVDFLIEKYLIDSLIDANKESILFQELLQDLWVNWKWYEALVKRLYEERNLVRLNESLKRLFTISPRNQIGNIVQKSLLVEDILWSLKDNNIESQDIAYQSLISTYPNDRITHLFFSIRRLLSGDRESAIGEYQKIYPNLNKKITSLEVLRLGYIYSLLEKNVSLADEFFEDYLEQLELAMTKLPAIEYDEYGAPIEYSIEVLEKFEEDRNAFLSLSKLLPWYHRYILYWESNNGLLDDLIEEDFRMEDILLAIDKSEAHFSFELNHLSKFYSTE